MDAGSLTTKVSQATSDNPEAQMVFLTENADTRYDQYSVLRSLEVAEEVEARKGN